MRTILNANPPAPEQNSSLPALVRLPAGFSFEQIEKAIQPSFGVRVKNSLEETVTFMDTPDSGLWKAGLLVVLRQGNLAVCERRVNWLGQQLAAIRAPAKIPRFAWDFPPSEFQRLIEKPMGLRALLPKITIHSHLSLAELINAEGKVVVRLALEDVGGKDSTEALRYCQLMPLIGYEAEAERIWQALGENGATPAIEGPLSGAFDTSADGSGKAGKYASFTLAAELSAREAVRLILLEMLGRAVSQESGVTDDIDTEFLHEYRVVLRKMRSLISLVKGVYPEEELAWLKSSLSGTAGSTNQLRDLDVYILERRAFESVLPEALRPGLDRLYTEFGKWRATEHRSVASRLVSSGHGEAMKKLEEFLSPDREVAEAENASLPIRPLVGRAIMKRYKRIGKLAAGLDASTDAETLHELRIEGKKLRYLIEFFDELFADEELEGVKKKLRRVQSILGSFNDCSIQEKFLLKYCRDRGKRKPVDPEIAMAVGGLVAVLELRRRDQREKATDALKSFLNGRTKDQMRRIFAPPAPEIPGPPEDIQIER